MSAGRTTPRAHRPTGVQGARSEVLLVGGRSGVGKSTAAIALHEALRADDVRHALIEGDDLDLAHPAPNLAFPDLDLAGRHLHLMWRSYRELGYRRLIYTNTTSVLEADRLAEAMGDDPAVTVALLQANDATAAERLHRRANGRAPDADVAHSARTARRLDGAVPERVHRLVTDDLAPAEVAARLRALTGW